MSEIDPITFSVVWNGLVSVAEEMGTALRRSAYSLGVREGRDFSTALFDSQGTLIAQGNFSPGHLGSMPFVVKHIIEEYPVEELEEGDSILLNDPYLGSGHLPDFFQVSPIFLNGELLGFAANCAHMVDVGGAGPGSQAVDSTDLYQEGIRFPAHPHLPRRPTQPRGAEDAGVQCAGAGQGDGGTCRHRGMPTGSGRQVLSDWRSRTGWIRYETAWH